MISNKVHCRMLRLSKTKINRLTINSPPVLDLTTTAAVITIIYTILGADYVQIYKNLNSAKKFITNTSQNATLTALNSSDKILQDTAHLIDKYRIQIYKMKNAIERSKRNK